MAGRNIQAYLPPVFLEADRLARMQAFFPEVDAMYRDYAEKNHFPGYAYGIVLDGQLVYSGSGGFINLEKKIPVTSKSMFRIASMTKSFTAMAILKLRDVGKIRLDDPIDLYIPEMQNQKITNDSPSITIRDLLIHSAGFPTDDPWADRKLDTTNEELSALLKKGLVFSNPPGVVFEYSNLGYAMLGSVIKTITGVSYGEYIRSEILDSIGMKDASWEFAEISEELLAHGYRWVDGGWQEEEMLHDGAFGPMGGMIASIESFSKIVAIHQSAWPPRDDEELGPINRSSIREMHRPSNFTKLMTDFRYAGGLECPMVHGYGYGLVWKRDALGRVFVGHNGGLPGFGSNWYFMPDYGLGLILFANVTYAQAFKVNLNVLDKLTGRTGLRPRKLPPSKILQERQGELIKLLPHWEHAETSGIFAENFFLDHPLESLKKESHHLFSKVGKILAISDLVAENQLCGYFIVTGEKEDLRISFELTPIIPGLIQQLKIIFC
jgi:CubicO group peptidase (beta-lactamase class C family)